MGKGHAQGFSLIELVMAILILTVIIGMASAVYFKQARSGRRMDGINTIMAISLAEEQYRSYNAAYGALATVWTMGSTTPQGFYTLAVSNVSATSYTVTATGVGDQVNDTSSGTSCSPLVLTVNNATGTQTQTPAVCWPT